MTHERMMSRATCCLVTIVCGLCVALLSANEPGMNSEAERHFEKANALHKLADYEGALAEYRAVMSVAPGTAIAQNAHYWVGQIQYEQHDFDAALATYGELLAQYPTSTVVPTTRVMIEHAKHAKKNRALFEAVKKADVEQVKSLIAAGADLDAKWVDVYNKNEEEDVSQWPANLRTQRTPLWYAVHAGKIEVVKLLVEAGADVNAGQEQWSPLCQAVDENNTAIAEYLIDHGANVNNPKDWGPLQETTHVSNNIEMVKLLIARGADINAGPWPTLHSAISSERRDIVELLIQHGVDVNAKGKWGYTPLFYAVYYAHFYDNAVVKLLIANGADVNTKDPAGETLLELAAITGRTEAVKLLVEAGANINAKNDRGQTALHAPLDIRNSDYKDYRLSKDTIELLVAKGAGVNLKDKDGRTPLHLATESADTDIVRLLLDKGARVNEKDDASGFTPLHHAARFGNKDAAELLIARGADINCKDKQGHTPLQVAVNHDYKVAALLMSKGADSAIHTEPGRTLLELAQQRKQMESTVPDMIFDGDPNSAFGESIACGDVDGDGYDDILVRAPRYDSLRGRVYLFYGGPDMDATADLIFEGQNEGDRVGTGIACGDIDHDGHDDIVIGAYSYSEKRPCAYLYWGSDRNSMDAKPDKVFTGGGERGSQFGAGHPVVYDIDNDGYGDIILGALGGHIILGAPGGHEATGWAYLYYGNTKELMDTSPDLILKPENPRDAFGSISCGDVDKDGYGDIVAGPWWSRDGRAYLFYGGSRSNMDAKADVIFKPQSEGDDLFGHGIVCIDQNGDGCDDIVMGAPGYNDWQGRSYLFHGSLKRSLDTDPDMTFSGEVEGSLYGSRESCYGDIDGDKVNDLVIGAYFYRRQVGRVYVYWGNELAGPNPKAGRILTGESPRDDFGAGLACGDVNNDGFDDLVVGAHGYKAGAKQGRVYLYYGGPRKK